MFILSISNHTLFLVHFGINLHLFVFQKAKLHSPKRLVQINSKLDSKPYDYLYKMHQMFSVHTTPEEFENEMFILKTLQMFSVHVTSEEFWICVWGKPGQVKVYWMVPSNLKVLAKFGLLSNCSQKLESARLLVFAKFFASARMLGFSLKFPAV